MVLLVSNVGLVFVNLSLRGDCVQFAKVWGTGHSTASKWHASGCRTLEDVSRRIDLTEQQVCFHLNLWKHPRVGLNSNSVVCFYNGLPRVVFDEAALLVTLLLWSPSQDMGLNGTTLASLKIERQYWITKSLVKELI